MSPDERLQQIARLIRDGSISPDDVAWLIDEVVRLNSENARLVNKIIAVRTELDNTEDSGTGYAAPLIVRLRRIVGPR